MKGRKLSKDFKLLVAIVVSINLILLKFWSYYYTGGQWFDENIIVDLALLEVYSFLTTFLVYAITRREVVATALNSSVVFLSPLLLVLAIHGKDQIHQYEHEK